MNYGYALINSDGMSLQDLANEDADERFPL